MPREGKASRQARVQSLIQRFKETYPDAHCELDFQTPLQLLIATILSAQSTDKQVNVVTQGLFREFRSVADFADCQLEDLERCIRTLGLYRAKAKNIRLCCRALQERHGGQVPQTMEELIQLAGVGRKTANVVLGNAFGRTEGVVVDTHVARLSQRLGLTRQSHAERIEQDLMELVPREEWTMFSHWLIWHGRRRCYARKPDCAGCEVTGLCPSRGLLM